MEKSVKQFEDLDVWKKAIDIAVSIYKLSDQGKLSKDFESRSQIRRSVISISNNIAEGFEYNNNNELIRYLKYAKGSAGEVRSQLYILLKVDYIDEVTFQKYYEKLIELSQQLANFIKYLKKCENKQK